VISTGDAQNIAEADIRRAFEVYIGEIEQSPPVFSALKSDGVPLYRLARAGNPIQKPPRKRFIYDSRILAIDLPRIRFQVTCSAGTYIRSLGADIGADLGCGGHLHALRRIGSGGFSLDDALAWEMFEGEGGEDAICAGIIGMADALRCMPACRADESLAEKIRHGKRLSAEDLCVDYPGGGDAGGGDPHIKIVDGQNSLLAVVKKTPEEGLVDYCCVFSSD
jgi:tRNA pseudouridine55 synthase